MPATGPRLRDYRPDDAEAIVSLFRAAVRETAASHYDAVQRAAWAPDDLLVSEWAPRLSGQNTLLAELDGEIAAFIAWDDRGLVDLMFTAPAFGRRGLASLLCREAETRMRTAGIRSASTHASHLSRPVFERQGWRVLEMERVELDGIPLQRFRMDKPLD